MLKRSITFLLVLSIVSSGLYLPTTTTPRAEAFLGFGDIDWEIGSHMRSIVDAIGMSMAQQLIDRMVQSTVTWAQSGFEGNPAYVTNPKQYFTDIADGVVGEFLKNATTTNGTSTPLAFLCSPFQANIKLSLAQQYYQPKPFECTLTGIVGNIESFYKDFSQGGWEAWFSMTQTPTNNPYGAYSKAKLEMDSQLAKALGLKKSELNWNQGFISWSDCIENETVYIPDSTSESGSRAEKGKCTKRGPTKTPGSTIKAQLDEVLPSGMKKLITAQHIDQLVGAFASGLLTRFVFGPKGLFATGSSNSNVVETAAAGGIVIGMIDLDADSIPDGQDFDFDGKLESLTDVCLHGNKAPNCTLSSTVTSSPYFSPVCEAVDIAVAALEDYGKFLDSHANQMVNGEILQGRVIGTILRQPVGFVIGLFGFGDANGIDNFKNKADADIWANRTNPVDTSISQVVTRVRDRHSNYFDKLETDVNRFSQYMGNVFESLIRDSDLDLARRGNGGGGLYNLMKHTAYNLRYLQEVKVKLGKCEKPEITGVDDIPSPPDVPQDGGQCAVEGNRYEANLRSAMDAVILDNPDVADLPNSEGCSDGDCSREEQRENARIFLKLVEGELRSRGFNATVDVLNGHNLTSTGDLIALWKEGDSMMERYDAISGSARTVGQAAQTTFAGFVPLDCTASGGGKDCGCQEEEAGGGGENPPGGTEPGTPGGPEITSVSPTSVTAGQSTLTIIGTKLTSTVQFFDGAGARYTVAGTVNSAGTQVTVMVPGELPVGNATVKVYKDAATISNGKLIQIGGSGGGAGIPTVTPTSSWSPSQTTNNWYPELSADGRYVAYGNWGESWVTDLETKQNYNFSSPINLPAGGRCIRGQWIQPDTLSFVCEAPPGNSFYRYEVKVGEWVAQKTGDDSSLVAGNEVVAADGHWASWLAAGFRLVQDNKVTATGAGGRIALSKNLLVHACTNANQAICVRKDGLSFKTYVPKTPLFGLSITDGYITYGGSGPVRGITPTGGDIDLTVAPWKKEYVGKVIMVGTTPWVVTTSYPNSGSGSGYIFLRPWGKTDLKDTIAISTNGGYPSIGYKNGVFTIATNTDTGRLTVVTVPAP